MNGCFQRRVVTSVSRLIHQVDGVSLYVWVGIPSVIARPWTAHLGWICFESPQWGIVSRQEIVNNLSMNIRFTAHLRFIRPISVPIFFLIFFSPLAVKFPTKNGKYKDESMPWQVDVPSDFPADFFFFRFSVWFFFRIFFYDFFPVFFAGFFPSFFAGF